MGVRHPNIWVFIRTLKDKEIQCRRVIHAADRGNQPPARKLSFRRMQEQIESLKVDYNSGRRNLKNYWAAIAHVVHNFS